MVQEVATACQKEPDVLSYYPTTRKDGKDAYITVFERYRSEDSYQRVMENLKLFT